MDPLYAPPGSASAQLFSRLPPQPSPAHSQGQSPSFVLGLQSFLLKWEPGREGREPSVVSLTPWGQQRKTEHVHGGEGLEQMALPCAEPGDDWSVQPSSVSELDHANQLATGCADGI